MAQNIDAMFFAEDAPMKDEFEFLFSSLFRKLQNYIAVVTALGKKKLGLTRNELAEAAGIPNSGYLTKITDELISCGFIRKYTEFGKKTKDSIYQLTDHYTLFYFQFLKKKPSDEHSDNTCFRRSPEQKRKDCCIRHCISLALFLSWL